MSVYNIGICVQYPEGEFTLAGVRFAGNGDIVVWMPVGDAKQLIDGTKHNPHVTYHGDGLYHLATYAGARRLPRNVRYPMERQRQEPSDSFIGDENVILWGFDKEDALDRHHVCENFDECILVDAELIEPIEWETLVDSLGEIKSPKMVGRATLQVDLIEPGRHDLHHGLVVNPERILVEKLIDATAPWCMITILR